MLAITVITIIFLFYCTDSQTIIYTFLSKYPPKYLNNFDTSIRLFYVLAKPFLQRSPVRSDADNHQSDTP
jgi:hypothetical protein